MSLVICSGAVQADAGTTSPPLAKTASVSSSAAPQAFKDARGRVAGYKISSADAAAPASLDAELGRMKPQAPNGARVAGVGDILLCAGVISGFIAFMVFPAARAAKIAVRLAGYVKRLGVKKVAPIMTRTYRGADSQKLFEEMAMELSGSELSSPFVAGSDFRR